MPHVACHRCSSRGERRERIAAPDGRDSPVRRADRGQRRQPGLPPTAGRIVFDGIDLAGRPAEAVAALGLVRTFQLVKPFGALTVLENVAVGRHLHTRSGLPASLLRTKAQRAEERNVQARARALLDKVGLGRQADSWAGVLPYGQLRLLEIARALAAEPRLLLLDEPAAGLNGEETVRLGELIRQIAADGTAVLLVEHDMALVMDVADQVAVIDFGRRIALGTPAEVRTNPAVIAAYLGAPELSQERNVPRGQVHA